MYICACLLALNAAQAVHIRNTTSHSIELTWSHPVGYYDGFHVYGKALSHGAVSCSDIVYGMSCMICDSLGEDKRDSVLILFIVITNDGN